MHSGHVHDEKVADLAPQYVPNFLLVDQYNKSPSSINPPPMLTPIALSSNIVKHRKQHNQQTTQNQICTTAQQAITKCTLTVAG